MLLPIIPPPMIRMSNDRSKRSLHLPTIISKFDRIPKHGEDLNGTALAHYKETDRRGSAPGHKEEGHSPSHRKASRSAC